MPISGDFGLGKILEYIFFFFCIFFGHELAATDFKFSSSQGANYVPYIDRACPPASCDDYIFHCKPPRKIQSTCTTSRLEVWYTTMLKKAKEIGVIQVFYGLFFGWLVHQVILFASPESDSNYFQDWFDLQGFIEKANIVRARDLPYFAGDCWPMVVSYFFNFFFLWENQVFFFSFFEKLNFFNAWRSCTRE